MKVVDSSELRDNCSRQSYVSRNRATLLSSSRKVRPARVSVNATGEKGSGISKMLNSEAIKDQLKTSAEVRFEKARDFDPPETYPTVGVAPPPAQAHGTHAGLPTQDSVSNAALLAVVTVEGISRLLGKGRVGRE